MSPWYWEQIDVNRSGAAGDLAKLFRHESAKRPGVMQIGAPSTDASLLARETIQNSWDAARAYRQELAMTGVRPPPFEIEFRFNHLVGEMRERLFQSLDLSDHAYRISRLQPDGQDPRKLLGLGAQDVLSRMFDDRGAPLRTLTITEGGTTGMYGPWTGTASKMWLALVSLGMTEKMAGAGGSYGYGKAGLIRGSRIRMVLAYTRFREQPSDEGVTRRFLGMTYWGLHTIGETSYTGFAFLGNSFDGDRGRFVRPWENDEADDAAERFGINLRDAGDPGTTFMLVDSGIETYDLVRAIERNWWPVLETREADFDAYVVDEEGVEHIPRPRNDPVLKTFIRGFELATVPQDNVVKEETVQTFNPMSIGDDRIQLGSLGLVSDEAGWSYPGQDDIDHRSLVALVRGPRMVVEYWEAGQAQPFVRGTFVADDEADDILRGTEPMAHDAWDATTGTTEDETGAEVARTIHARIRSQVNRFRAALKPPIPDRRELRLPDLEKLMRGVFEGSGTGGAPPPPAPERNVGISLDQSPAIDPTDPRKIRLEARASLHLTDHVRDHSSPVRVRIRYMFVEDGSAGEKCPVTVQTPGGFQTMNDADWFVGSLGHEPVSFHIVSEGYPPDWSGRLVVESDLESAFTEVDTDGE